MNKTKVILITTCYYMEYLKDSSFKVFLIPFSFSVLGSLCLGENIRQEAFRKHLLSGTSQMKS